MRKVDVGEANLYLGVAKEISHAYRHLRGEFGVEIF